MVVRFGPADVGRRVTLRRQLAPGDPSGAALGDVVGVLESWSEEPDHGSGTLALRRRTGEVVDVAAPSIVAGRVVAPEVSAAELASRADDAWRARENSRLGEWRLRAHAGLTHRPNSALAVGDPGVPLDEAAEAVRAWYSERGLRPAVMTPLPSPLVPAFAKLGWHLDAPTLVQSIALADLVTHDVEGPVVEVDLTDALPDAWTAVLPRLAHAEVAPVFRELLVGSPSTVFATVTDDDGPVAVARGAITDGWMNVTNVEVLERARGRRLAAHVVVALGRWALEQRATHAYLQMWPDNTSALRLYERLGFTLHHRYAYLVPD
jgi:GNAT superfamily N-acetyltransferase